MTSRLQGRGVQEMPPPGGYKILDVSRKLPGSRVHGAVIFGGITAICVFGFYVLGQGNIERRELRAEKRAIRAAILPFVQAEEDVEYVRQHTAAVEHERKVMAHVPGWEAGKSVYNTGRWLPKGENRVP